MTHKYRLTIQFETEKMLTPKDDSDIQFGYGLDYFVVLKSGKHVCTSYEAGTGKIKLKKIKKDSSSKKRRR